MLEDLALQYSDFSEDQIRLVHYGLAVVGGILGGLSNRSTDELRRAPYFALSGLILVFIGAATFASVTFVVPALVGGFSWIIVGLEALLTVVGGFFLARIAMARSRDAYGYGGRAVLAFIPIANLWLLFAPSKYELSSNRPATIPLLSGTLGILTGLILMISGLVLSGFSQVEAARRVEAAAAAGVFDEVMLDRILAGIAAELQSPMPVDNITTMVGVEAEENELRYIYELEPAPEFLSVTMRIGLLEHNCGNPDLINLINSGAVIEHVYLRKDGSEVGNVQVTQQACGG